jgi:hypothetical protein
MSHIDLSELENAMIMVEGPDGTTRAWVARETGFVHMHDDYMDEAPLPANVEDEGRYVPVPGIHELDLGKQLVLRFTREYLPGDEERVRDIFRKKGAYARFSNLLDQRGERDNWHRFRDEETATALHVHGARTTACNRSDLTDLSVRPNRHPPPPHLR